MKKLLPIRVIMITLLLLGMIVIQLSGQTIYLSANAGVVGEENRGFGGSANIEFGYLIGEFGIGLSYTNFLNEAIENPLAEKWNTGDELSISSGDFPEVDEHYYHRDTKVAQHIFGLIVNREILSSERFILSAGTGVTYYRYREIDFIANFYPSPGPVSQASFHYRKARGIGWHANVKGLFSIKQNLFLGLKFNLESTVEYYPGVLLAFEAKF